MAGSRALRRPILPGEMTFGRVGLEGVLGLGGALEGGLVAGFVADFAAGGFAGPGAVAVVFGFVDADG